MGRKAGISLDDVVEVAVEIADRDGIECATPSAVAHALGIRTPSLYHHVEGAAGLRRALALEATRRLTDALASAAPRASAGPERTRAMARAYRSFAVDHPGLHAALLPAPTREQDPELYEAMAAPVALVAAGITVQEGDPAATIHTIRAIRALLYGFVELETRHGFGMPVDIDRSFAYALELILPG